MVVVDDHQMVLDSVVAALKSDADIDVVGTATSIVDGIAVVLETSPDVVICDFMLPGEVGTDIVAGVENTSAKVLLITGSDPLPVVAAALASGCAGFMSKGGGIDQLVEAVHAIAAGASVYPAELLRQVVANRRKADQFALTDRENEILRQLADAQTAASIAGELSLSEHTVRNHIRNVLTKLHARSQLEAVVIAVQTGLVTIA